MTDHTVFDVEMTDHNEMTDTTSIKVTTSNHNELIARGEITPNEDGTYAVAFHDVVDVNAEAQVALAAAVNDAVRAEMDMHHDHETLRDLFAVTVPSGTCTAISPR